MEKSYIIKQISIFSENRPGRLAAVAGALRDAGINIFAFTIAEANGFGVVRALVNRPEDAHRTLTGLGFRVSFTDVIGVKMRDASVVRGIGVLPVFAGLIGLLLLIGAFAATWLREGR